MYEIAHRPAACEAMKNAVTVQITQTARAGPATGAEAFSSVFS